MNKQELITRNLGVKLYDLSDPIDLHRMNMNLAYCSKKGKNPTFKLIAPFGHILKFKADYYYFESENTPITEQILEEMGFYYSEDLENHIGQFWIKYTNGVRIVYQQECNVLTINNYTKNFNANQLHTLIELLNEQ